MAVIIKQDIRNRSIVFEGTILDREIAAALEPRALLNDVRSMIVQEIGKKVMAQLGPAIDQALLDLAKGVESNA